jgi:hypothetical protein
VLSLRLLHSCGTLSYQIFYMEDNNGGALRCFAYGAVACPTLPNSNIVTTLTYPNACDVDETTSTIVVGQASGAVVAINYASTPVIESTVRVGNARVAGLKTSLFCAWECFCCR